MYSFVIFNIHVFNTNTTRFNSFIDTNFCRIYTNISSLIILQMESRMETVHLKTLIGNFWFVGKSIVNNFTDGFTNRPCAQNNNNNYPPQFVGNALSNI